MSPFFLSKNYHRLLPIIKYLPIKLQVQLASFGRKYFMQQFVNHTVVEIFKPKPELAIKMWGIEFRTPLSNSAGMFKNGEGYDVIAKLGAGAYIGGTSTANPRLGNKKYGVYLPFISLPESKTAINWLGLPNLGDETLSRRQITNNKLSGCPIGWSVTRSPDFTEDQGVRELIKSLWLYHDNSQIDFIEINESCPNIKLSGDSILTRMEIIAQDFLSKRKRHLPIVVKLSNDVSRQSLTEIITGLVKLGYDGINLGNTSTNYADAIHSIAVEEKELFNYFITKFGGGISGKVLKKRSLELCACAAETLYKLNPEHEFHIIRSGGVSDISDIESSRQHGISFNQWYTGFYSLYAIFGDKAYQGFWSTAS